MESASVTVDCECCAKRFDPSAVDVQTHGRNGGGRGGGGGGGGGRLIEVSSMGVKESSLQNGRIRYRTDENGRISHSLSKSESLLGIEGRAVAAAAVAAAAAAAAASDAEQGNDSVGTRDDVDDNDDESICNAVTQLDVSENKSGTCKEIIDGIEYVVYESELQMPDIIRLITKDLSEPYSIYTYRYFIHNWPKLCFLAMDSSRCVGAIVCKLDLHKRVIRRGYIAMLAVDAEYRRKKIGSNLVLKAIRAMLADGCDEVVLETEITNRAALRLYENLGFVRDKRLFRYYLNGVDALRLKLWLR